ncbi:molybdopterin molybdotransferase MoeA [Chryseobacterium sp. SSA4.19]|uniref:molybdopterin molybdotransferase MoeA n=1 Tax=Chryseobacterium sp. SSA4.19 TaxID=2919915 RepID=UPI001F4E9525|nr:gephyrin-like molybdotransferase Glp [Chryseobacterium sp. SSA4.19]MCJ8152732.1 molybdopterin molybdotransferase MoeA [Chryseobacterium sp. SSA4.19]
MNNLSSIMISVQVAKNIIHNTLLPRRKGILPISEASGFVTADEIFASVDIPNFAQSSMDGYAIRFEDRDQPLRIVGEMAAGSSRTLKIKKGEATRIFTGAPLPDCADTVVMQEKVRVENGILVVLDQKISVGLNVRPRGSEIKSGVSAMDSDTYLSPATIGFLAGIGCIEVPVFLPPRVALILTGNELQSPGQPLEFGQVYEANSFQLTAALKKTGIQNIDIYTAEDHPELLYNVLQKALMENDVVLLNGGVSVGDYDFVTQAAEKCKIKQQFHKIRQKPGKPLFFGTKDEKLVFGLPGNPSSSLTCFYEYVLPALEKCMGLRNSLTETTAIVTNDYIKPPGFTHFLKGFYDHGKVMPLHAQESYRLHSFAQANCFIVLDENSMGCQTGEEVKVHLLPV